MDIHNQTLDTLQPPTHVLSHVRSEKSHASNQDTIRYPPIITHPIIDSSSPFPVPSASARSKNVTFNGPPVAFLVGDIYVCVPIQISMICVMSSRSSVYGFPASSSSLTFVFPLLIERRCRFFVGQ
ncbi:hypothetical protein ABKN59_000529 [Abortiporus biennis]